MGKLKVKVKNFKNSLRQNGIKTEVRRLNNLIKTGKTVPFAYDEWILLNEPNEKEIANQENYKTPLNTKFLIFVDDKKSLGKQTYKNYEVSGYDNDIAKKIKSTKNDYCIFIGKDIELQNFALYEILRFIEMNECNVIYTDNDFIQDGKRVNPVFKPHYAYDNILSKNYFDNLIIVKTNFLIQNIELLENLNNDELIYNLILRLITKTKRIMHIDKIIYHKLSNHISTEAQKNIIKEYLNNSNIEYDDVLDGEFEGQYKINYKIKNKDLISIIIPNMDHIVDLQKCLDSIKKSTYKNYEVIIVENNSKDDRTFRFYEQIKSEKIKVEELKISEFNYSRIVNFGVSKSSGKYVVMLNNDIELLSPDWLEQMLMYVQRKDVGICGARLYFPDDTIQHAGVTLGVRGLAGHRYRLVNKNDFSKEDSISYVQDLTAVTAACFMVSREDWDKVVGFDEKLAVAFNDVDFCLKIRKEKKLVVYNPFVQAYHYESKSRGEDTENKEKQKRFEREYNIFVNRWGKTIAKGDPYFSVNYRLDTDIPTINYNKRRI